MTRQDTVDVFNIQLTLAQALSPSSPEEALDYLEHLPSSYKNDIAAKSVVCSYYCIFAYEKGDFAAFRRYYEQYDSLRCKEPERFSPAYHNEVMIYRHLVEKDYPKALAWCDSIIDPIESAEYRTLTYQQIGWWQKAYTELARKDSLTRLQQNVLLEEDLNELTREILTIEKAKRDSEIAMRHYAVIVLSVCLLLALLLAICLYRQGRKTKSKNLALGNLINELLDNNASPAEHMEATIPQYESPEPANDDKQSRLFIEIDQTICDEHLYANVNFQRQDRFFRLHQFRLAVWQCRADADCPSVKL